MGGRQGARGRLSPRRFFSVVEVGERFSRFVHGSRVCVFFATSRAIPSDAIGAADPCGRYDPIFLNSLPIPPKRYGVVCGLLLI